MNTWVQAFAEEAFVQKYLQTLRAVDEDALRQKMQPMPYSREDLLAALNKEAYVKEDLLSAMTKEAYVKFTKLVQNPGETFKKFR